MKHTTSAWEQAVELIQRSTRPLLICHVYPDGDAIGSLLGLGLGLRALGKTPTLACEHPSPPKFSFLSGYDTIVNTLDSDQFDLVIGLDSSDLARLGNVYDADRLHGIPLVIIDHHATNLYFGDVNLVDPTVASTAQLVLALLDHLGVPVEQDIANCLLTGITTDTVGFRTANVTPQVMKDTMRLMEAGASLSLVAQRSFNQRPLIELSLLARGLGRLEAEHGLAYSEILLADRRACGYQGGGDVGLVGMLARTKEVHIAAVFVEKENNEVEVGFRADPGYDVAQVALGLGGGGHAAASGCTVPGSLEAVKARVLPLLRAALDEQRKQVVEE
jgi:phosphoesterase RecJ-like protein